MENNELTQNQIAVEIRRISKNIQFFFWLTIASIGLSIITAIYFSAGSTKQKETQEIGNEVKDIEKANNIIHSVTREE